MSIEACESAEVRPRPVTGKEPSPLYRDWLRRQRREVFIVRGAQLFLVVAFLVLWEIAPRMHWVNPMLTSYPSAVWVSFLSMIAEGELGKHVAVTVLETVVSFLLSMAIGTAGAIALWMSDRAQKVLDPFLVVANALPKIALVPIFYLWLGAELSIYGIAVAVAVFITMLMIFTGFQQTDHNKIKLVRTLGASRVQILTKVVLPGNVPTFIAALKANAGLSLVGVIVGEFQSAKAGLGYLIIYGSQIFRMDMVMAAIVILGLMSLVLYMAIQLFERALVKPAARNE